ncbi:MAG: DNA replication and repair protein RecF [Bacilli bacterium]|nr:DNA replication and repair protein RecF [Bacilli bacterium]
MQIKELKLINYRNFKKLDLTFAKTNFFYGLNGVGKTNIVEAIAYLTNLSSFRYVSDDDLINKESSFFTIEATFKQQETSYVVKVVNSFDSKKVYIDDKEIRKKQDYLSQFITVCFTPQDVFLFKDSKNKRREFLNDEIMKISPVYYVSLNNFNKLLKTRNDYLKKENIDRTLLDVYTSLIAKYSYEIMLKRYQFIHQLEYYTNIKYHELSGSNDEITIEYDTFLKENELTIENILKKYHESLNEDLNKKVSNIGIQKDDFTLYINHQKMANYGSQGQNRLASIAIKLAMIEIASLKTGDRPIVILDDVFSELDSEKQKNLLRHLQNESQIFLTMAHKVKSDEGKIYFVSNSGVKEE